MLGNCDNKMITNQWPHPQPQQNQISSVVDDRIRMASSSPNKVGGVGMGAAAAADPLKCPRCDSSNTKFCYYNNYSLSQPRHFCKACKRYWTRGGTLRNVPVGGGCRKNKRPKRHSHPHIDPPQPPPPPQPLFYPNPLELNFPFSSFRVSSDDHPSFDLHPQINSLGLGFSSDQLSYKNGIQDAASFSSPANNGSIFFGSSSTASTMASLLASTHKFGDPYEDPAMGKQVKAEGENRMPWNPNPNATLNQNTNPTDQINSSDPSLWNASTIGAWFDPSSMGSSVPSLI